MSARPDGETAFSKDAASSPASTRETLLIPPVSRDGAALQPRAENLRRRHAAAPHSSAPRPLRERRSAQTAPPRLKLPYFRASFPCGTSYPPQHGPEPFRANSFWTPSLSPSSARPERAAVLFRSAQACGPPRPIRKAERPLNETRFHNAPSGTKRRSPASAAGTRCAPCVKKSFALLPPRSVCFP